MVYDRLRKFLFDKIKRDYLTGKITGVAHIPSDQEVQRSIDSALASASNGIMGSLTTISRKSVSNPLTYNTNFETVGDNLKYILGEIYNNLNETIDIINNSTLEKNQILRELKMANIDFSDIETGSLHADGLKYLISDHFYDTEKVDLSRTTAMLNLNAGLISLDPVKSAYLSFPHYRNQTVINFTVTEGFSKVLKQEQVPFTSFGAIFSDDDTDHWEYKITTSAPTQLEGHFILKLSEIGDSVDINDISFRFASSKSGSSDADMIAVYYMGMDKTDRNWRLVSNGKQEIKGEELQIKFPTINTTHLKVVWTKFYPDDNVKMEYNFGLIALKVGHVTSVYESVLVTKALEIQPYQNENPTIYAVELNAQKSIQEGSNIHFYVGVDEPVSGKIVDTSNNIVDITSESASSFVANGSGEDYYSYASQLRDAQHISGTFTYKNWDPKWQEISTVDTQITATPNQLFFNVSDIDHAVLDLYYTAPILWGDSSYTGPWPVAAYTGSWADNWDGTPNGFPQSGYIWGEDPLTTAGIWWGDAKEFAGWWRPHTPSCSGTITWNDTNKISIPDFIVPVYDTNGNPVYEYNKYTQQMVPLQKTFWKVFKWPSTSLPIPGTVKLQARNSTSVSEVIDNKNVWKWNYKSKVSVEDITISFDLDENTRFYTIKLEKQILDKTDIKILQDSVRDVQIASTTPGTIEDYFVEYGYDYIVDPDTKLFQRQATEPSYLADAHATIIFGENVAEYRARTGNKKPHITLTLSYTCKSDIVASWDGIFFVPSESSNIPTCRATVPEGIQKIVVQQFNDNGIILTTKEVTTSFNAFELFPGQNKVRIFVDTLPAQDDRIDGSLALWRPDAMDVHPTADVLATGLNDYPQDDNWKNKIYSSTTDFIGTYNIIPQVKILLHCWETAEDFKKLAIDVPATISKVEEHELEIIPDNTDKEYYIQSWELYNFTARSYLTYENAVPGVADNYMKEVDINILLHETDIEDDAKYSIIEDVDSSKYLVVKAPLMESFPSQIQNILHYTRTYYDSVLQQFVTYTTGTSGNYTNANHPIVYTTAYEDESVLANNPPNTDTSIVYGNISTYGEYINVSDPSASGFLFWDTGENLQTYYSIKFAKPVNNYPVDRLFLMAKLLSNSPEAVPVLDSYQLIINNKIRSVS